LADIANIKFNLGDYPAAQTHACQAQRLAQLSADLYHEARALNIEVMCYTDLGDYKTSISQCHRGRKLLGLCGMSGGHLDLRFMNNEAEIHFLKSEYVEAHSIHTQIVQTTSADQDADSYAFGLMNLAEIDIMSGKSEQHVRQKLDKAKEIFNHMEHLYALNYCNIYLGALNLREGLDIPAKTTFLQCINSGGHDGQGVLLCMERLADVKLWSICDFKWTSRWTVVYFAYANKLHNKLAFFKAIQFLGDVFYTQGDQDTANSLFTVALEAFTSMDVHRSRAQCMLHLGDISQMSGDLVKAVRLWNEARPLFERSQQAKEITRIQARIVAVEREMLTTHHRNLAQLEGLNVSTMITMFEVGMDENVPLIEELDENGALTLVAS
jgi:tetratricopeptide (TPR) repeat protein